TEEENMDVSEFRRGAGSLARRLLLLFGGGGLVLGMLAASATGAAAARPASCTGSFESPGVLAGTYSSNVTVTGVCAVNAGPSLIKGKLTLDPWAVLVPAVGLGVRPG